MLVVPLSDIGDDGVDIDAELVVSDLQPEGVEPLPAASVAISGHLSEVGGDFLFMGSLTGVFVSTCDRCLQAAEMPFEVEVAWNFEVDPAKSFEEAGLEFDEELDLEDTAVCRAIHNEEVDLGAQVWEELVLALPWKFLCSEDCRGLCAGCGKDLNAGPCGCGASVPEPETGTQGLAAGLAKMFPDLKAD